MTDDPEGSAPDPDSSRDEDGEGTAWVDPVADYPREPREPKMCPTCREPMILRHVCEHDENGLPPKPTHNQVLVYLASMDPIEQEVMIAQRLSSLPSQRDGAMPVNIPRMVRAPWARWLRRMGLFCFPELAVSEIEPVDPDDRLKNLRGMNIRDVERPDLWATVRKLQPRLAQEVDAARESGDPQQILALKQRLYAKLPLEQRMALQRLERMTPEDLELQ